MTNQFPHTHPRSKNRWYRRKFVKAATLFLLTCVLLISSSASFVAAAIQTPLDEPFNDSSQFTTSTTFFSDAGVSSGFDFFGISDGAGGGDFGGDPMPVGVKAYTGLTGSFLTGMDMDGEGATLPITLDWTGVNISGLTSLEFSGDFAEFFDTPGDIDDLDFIKVQYQIDGAGYVDLIWFSGADFTSTSGPFNGFFREDTDFNGVGDGITLGDAAQTFTKSIAGTGSTLDLRMIVTVDSGDEDFAVDNFKISGDDGGGTGDTTPPLIQSFTPADDATDVAVNNNLLVEFNESVQFGSGNITLHLSSDDSVVEIFDVATSGQLSVSGSTVTIDPTSDLSNSTGYYVTIDNGAVEDLAGNPYQGFSGTGVWNFTTAGAAAEADLVISEIMYNPASAEDDWEWVEVYNAGGSTADLAGYVIDDINGTAHSSANIAAGTIAPGETAVLYNADDITAADFAAAWGNGANLIAVTNWGAMGLNNGGDTVSLWDSFAAYSGDHTTHANALVTVAFDDDGTVWPADDGAASIYLTNLAADANDGTNWALSTVGAVTPTFTAYQSLAGGGNSGSDIGSPAEAKVELVVSEIMYNPASAEDNWEWVEIVNVGVLTADLTDYVIDDNNSTAHSAANIAGGTVANGESAILYNADDITAADFEAAWGTGINLVAVSDWGAMALNNGGDTLGIWGSFADYSGDHATHANALISIAYDDSGSWPVDDGNGSIYLTDLAADPNDGANWALSGIGVDTPVFTGYQSIVAGGNSGSDVGSPAAESIPPAVCGDPITPIYDIQGNGFASLLDGDYVATEGIVTATFFGTNQMGGYYIQDAAGDGDAATSDGIYVFTTFFDTPVVGDKIRVSGQVDEYFGLTEITNVGDVLNCGADTPITATEL
ncbi:MAG: lamin tail domain-containing protein, partial [Anaerolineales bacterium]|nr:lamin tail domain-containing protein [Anaerolineales bacterium]